MPKVNISSVNVELGKHIFSVGEIVDDIFRENVSQEVRDFCKEKLGIDKVHKNYDLYELDFHDPRYKEPDESFDDMQKASVTKTMTGYRKHKSNIGMVVTAGDNPGYLTPSPTMRLMYDVDLPDKTRDVPLQGMACSALSESARIAAGHFATGGDGDALVSISTNYTPWFVNMLKQSDQKIDMGTKESLHNFIYSIIFNDSVGTAILSKDAYKDSFSVDTEKIFSRRDVGGYGNYWMKHAPSMDGMSFKMYLNSKKLKESVAYMSSMNMEDIRMSLVDYEKIKSYGLHTAGKPIVDKVRNECGIKYEDTRPTYDLMSETGNTGPVSSLQIMKESRDRGVLKKGDVGCMLDYAWGRADTFLYEVL